MKKEDIERMRNLMTDADIENCYLEMGSTGVSFAALHRDIEKERISKYMKEGKKNNYIEYHMSKKPRTVRRHRVKFNENNKED